MTSFLQLSSFQFQVSHRKKKVKVGGIFVQGTCHPFIFIECKFFKGDSMRQRHGDAGRVPVPHHLFVNLKSFTYNTIGEDTDIFFSLYDLREGKHIRWGALWDILSQEKQNNNEILSLTLETLIGYWCICNLFIRLYHARNPIHSV